MKLEQLAKTWNAFGERDPLWAILSRDEARGNRWDPDAFFATGRAEIERVLAQAGEHATIHHGRALDFGCGVGRLSQALALHFDEVHGVDIAASMIDQARAYNRFPHCDYYLNERPSLALFPDRHFDFVYSNITLQHIEPALAHGYLRELCRVLSPAGVLVFQLPTRPLVERSRVMRLGHDTLRSGARLWRRRVQGRPQMEMYGTPQDEVEALIRGEGCRVVHTEASEMHDWHSIRYCAVPDPARS